MESTRIVHPPPQELVRSANNNIQVEEQDNYSASPSISPPLSKEVSGSPTNTPNSALNSASLTTPAAVYPDQNSDVYSKEGSLVRNPSVSSNQEASAITTEDYIVTPYYLIENLNLIGNEPSIHELIKPLSVPSIISNYSRLVVFLESNYPDLQNRDSKDNPRHRELNIIDHHDDSLFLSTMLIVLTLNQIIAELLIKLKKQKFKSFLNYPKKFLMFRPFKNFKNLCHFKVMEIMSLIEKNFIVPPIIPQNRLNTKNATKNHLSQHQVYNNLSLSCIQLCNYYHILNLTNTLNSTNSTENNYGNEAQEHQKILFIHRAITYFQLINLKPNDSKVQVEELYELLYSFERYYLAFSSHNYNINMTRNNDVILSLCSQKYGGTGFIYELMKSITEMGLMNDLCYKSNFNVSLNYSEPTTGYFQFKTELDKLNPQEPVHKILRNIILFKTLLVKPLSFEESKEQILEIMTNLNSLLEINDSDVFKVKISNYQILQPMLHCLKIFLEIKQVEVKMGLKAVEFKDQMILVKFSDTLILHFPFFNNINKLIRAHKILNNWFLNLSEIKKDDQLSHEQNASSPKLADTPQSQSQQKSFHTPEAVPFDANQISFTPHLPQTNSQVRIASQIDLQGLLEFEKMLGNNITPMMQHRADDEEEEENGQENDFFTIVPKNQYGSQFSASAAAAATAAAGAAGAASSSTTTTTAATTPGKSNNPHPHNVSGSTNFFSGW
ncbi:hypothetical protein SBY92_000874 [Candida maltosa Xu316]